MRVVAILLLAIALAGCGVLRDFGADRSNFVVGGE